VGAAGLTGATAFTLTVVPPGTAEVVTPVAIDPAVAAVTNLVTSPDVKLVLILSSAEEIDVALGSVGVVPGIVGAVEATAALSCSTTLPCVTAAVLDMAVSDSAMVAPSDAVFSRVLLCDTTLAMLVSESALRVVLLISAALVTAD